MAMAAGFWEDSDDGGDLDLEAVRVLLNALDKRGGHLPVTSLLGYVANSPREVMLRVGTTRDLVHAFVEDHSDHFVLADDGEVYSRAALEQKVVTVLAVTLDRRGSLPAHRLIGCIVNSKTARLYFGTGSHAAVAAGITQLAHERPDQFVVDEDDEISLYTDTEVEALNVLIEALLRRGPLPPNNLTGHVASAPNRDVLECVGRTAADVLQFAESFPDIFEVADGRVQLKFRRDVLLSKPEWSNRSIIDDLTKTFLLHGPVSFDELALCYENDHMMFLLDSSGYVIQDGDKFRLSPDAFLLRPQETAVSDGSSDVSDSSSSSSEAQVGDFEQLKAEASQFLRRVLEKNGSMPMKSLVGHLSQASSAVRQAAGSNVEGLTVFCHSSRDLVEVGPATSLREAPVSLITHGQQAPATGPSSAPEDTERESLHNKACDIVKIAGHCAVAEFLDSEEEIHLSSHLFPADIRNSFHKLMEGDRLVVDATIDFRPKMCGHSTKWRATKARLVKTTESSFKKRLSEVQISEQGGQHKKRSPASRRVEAFVLDVDAKLNCAIVVTDSGSVSILPLAPPAPDRGALTRGSLVEVLETPDVRPPGSQSYIARALISAPQPKEVPSARLGHPLVAKVIAIGNEPNILLLQTLDGVTIQGRASGLIKASFGCHEVSHHLVVGDVIRCKLDTVTEGPNTVAKVSDVDVLSSYVSFRALRQKNFLSWSGEMAACVADIPTTLASLLPASPKCTSSAIKRGRGTVVAVWDRLLVISMAGVECACAVFSTNAVSHVQCQVGDVVCFHATRDADETSGITWSASEVWRQTDTFRAMVQPAVTSSLPVRDGSSQTDITGHIMGYRNHCGP